MYDAMNPEENCTLFGSEPCNSTDCANPNNGFNCSTLNWSSADIPSLTFFNPDPSLAEFQLQSRFWIQRILVPI
ncbi:hypothetical protein AVEN_23791-1, partial [Araneus ventricosus]